MQCSKSSLFDHLVGAVAPVQSDLMADLAAAMVRAAQSPNPELIRAEIGKMAQPRWQTGKSSGASAIRS